MAETPKNVKKKGARSEVYCQELGSLCILYNPKPLPKLRSVHAYVRFGSGSGSWQVAGRQLPQARNVVGSHCLSIGSLPTLLAAGCRACLLTSYRRVTKPWYPSSQLQILTSKPRLANPIPKLQGFRFIFSNFNFQTSFGKPETQTFEFQSLGPNFQFQS